MNLMEDFSSVLYIYVYTQHFAHHFNSWKLEENKMASCFKLKQQTFRQCHARIVPKLQFTITTYMKKGNILE